MSNELINTSPEKRKVTQIAATVNALYALADDGTIWVSCERHPSWQQGCAIPQDRDGAKNEQSTAAP